MSAVMLHPGLRSVNTTTVILPVIHQDGIMEDFISMSDPIQAKMNE